VEKASKSRHLSDLAALAGALFPERSSDPLKLHAGQVVPSIFGDTLPDEISGEVLKCTSNLMAIVRPLYPTPPRPTEPGEFFKNKTTDEPYVKDSDVDWIAVWNAKMRQARTANLAEIGEHIHATLGLGEKMIRSFRLEALMELRALIETDLASESTSFEGLFQRLFRSPGDRRQAVTTVAEAEYLRRCCPVKDIVVMDLFAWQIPHLLPECAGRSRTLGGHYWTLLSVQWLARYDSKGRMNECPPKWRAPWTEMRSYAQLLRQ
jgi:hypothetical protein